MDDDHATETPAGVTATGGPAGRPPKLLDQVSVFRYATAPNAPTYRAIMQVCYEAVQRYVVELRAPDILAAVRASGYAVDIADLDELESGRAADACSLAALLLIEYDKLCRSDRRSPWTRPR